MVTQFLSLLFLVSPPHLSFPNRNKSINFACFWAEIWKNTRLLQKNQLKTIQLSTLFHIFVPSFGEMDVDIEESD